MSSFDNLLAGAARAIGIRDAFVNPKERASLGRLVRQGMMSVQDGTYRFTPEGLARWGRGENLFKRGKPGPGMR